MDKAAALKALVDASRAIQANAETHEYLARAAEVIYKELFPATEDASSS